MRFSLVLSSSLVVSFSWITPVCAVPIVTASHALPPQASSWFNAGAGISSQSSPSGNREAQTFTAAAGGILDHVSFIATEGTVTNVDLRVTITSLTGGQPDQTLATTLLSVNSFPAGELSGRPDAFNGTADFSQQNVLLAAQSQYAIVLNSDSVEANYRIYGDSSGYEGGERLFSQGGAYSASAGTDLFFAVTVTPVPEPAAAVSAAIACLTLLVVGFSKRSRRRACAI